MPKPTESDFAPEMISADNEDMASQVFLMPWYVSMVQALGTPVHGESGEGRRHEEAACAEERVVAGDVSVKVDDDSKREGEHTVIRGEPEAGEIDRAHQGQGTADDGDERDVRGH